MGFNEEGGEAEGEGEVVPLGSWLEDDNANGGIVLVALDETELLVAVLEDDAVAPVVSLELELDNLLEDAHGDAGEETERDELELEETLKTTNLGSGLLVETLGELGVVEGRGDGEHGGNEPGLATI